MKRLFCLLMLVATGGLLANGKIITGVNEDGDETTCMGGGFGVDGCGGGVGDQVPGTVESK